VLTSVSQRAECKPSDRNGSIEHLSRLEARSPIPDHVREPEVLGAGDNVLRGAARCHRTDPPDRAGRFSEVDGRFVDGTPGSHAVTGEEAARAVRVGIVHLQRGVAVFGGKSTVRSGDESMTLTDGQLDAQNGLAVDARPSRSGVGDRFPPVACALPLASIFLAFFLVFCAPSV
jgi:hypothetical protein